MKLQKLIQTCLLTLSFQLAAFRATAQQRPDSLLTDSVTTQQIADTLTEKTTTEAFSFAQQESARRRNYSALVMNAETGEILYSRSSDQPRFPASTIKIMTAYLTFKALRAGKITLDEPIPISKLAASQPYAPYLKAGGKMTVEEALLALLIPSSNSAAVVLAEKVSGSVGKFSKEMNSTAKRLGMDHSHFVNPNGRTAPSQHTTVDDMAKLSLAVMNDFPEYYALFGQRTFTYPAGRKDSFVYHNHNRLQGVYEGMDGIKTGYIPTSGFHLVTSATRGEERVLVIVFGASTKEQRTGDVISLLDFGFARLKNPALTYMPGRHYTEIKKLEPRPITLIPVEIKTDLKPLPAPPLVLPEKKVHDKRRHKNTH